MTKFGFKKNSSCAHVLFAFKESIRYCTGNNIKVYTAFLDASKAFDQVLHNGLFVKCFDAIYQCVWLHY